MKKIIALTLAAMLLAATATQTFAISGKAQQTPIYTGFWDADAVVETIIKQSGARGQSGDYERVQAVYDWVINNCRREGERNKEYITYEELRAAGETWMTTIQEEIDTGKAAVWASYTDLDNYYDNGYNTADNLAYIALDMGVYRVGDCVSFSSLLAVLLQHLGYECYVIPGEFINSDGSHVMHKWNMMYIGDAVYWLDVRIDDQATGDGAPSHAYFLKTDEEEWAKKHEWNREYTDAIKNQHAMGRRSYYFNNIDYSALEAPTWTKCSPWAETFLSQARDVSMIPACLKGQDMTKAITREEFAALAVSLYEKLSGQTAQQVYPSPFIDTNNVDVLKAYGLGIVNGDTKTTFNPKGLLTREQAAAMLGRTYASVKGQVDLTVGADVEPFADDGDIAEYSREFVYFLHAYEVINGVGDNRFDPWGKTTREEAVKIAVLTYDLSN